jgi:hypothetical protein
VEENNTRVSDLLWRDNSKSWSVVIQSPVDANLLVEYPTETRRRGAAIQKEIELLEKFLGDDQGGFNVINPWPTPQDERCKRLHHMKAQEDTPL